MFCRERAARFAAERGRLDSLGVGLAFVGNGNPGMAADFREQFDLTDPLFTDPGRRSYAALGFERKFGLGLKSIARGKRANDGGFRQGRTRGDVWQQGGVVLFDSNGEVRWKHVDDGAGHQADLAGLLAAAQAVAEA